MSVPDDLRELGRRYADAWSSQDASRVAACFSATGVLVVNDGRPAQGRPAIAEVAQEYMATFPDLVVECDRMVVEGGELRWYWTMKGTSPGSGGTGHAVDISGYEALVIDDDGLIESARGHFDEEEYARQLAGGG